MKRAAVACMALLLCNCSLIGTETPPPVATWPKRSDCNPGYARPVTDAVLAVAGTVAATGGAAIVASPTPGTIDNASHTAGGVTIIAGGAAVAAFFAISAAVGYGRVRSCVEALATWQAEHPNEKPDADPTETAARQYLGCPVGELKRETISFGRNNALADPYRWGETEFTGCGRITWCGERTAGTLTCGASPDLEAAEQQLSVETGCPVGSIIQRQRFATHTLRGRNELVGQSTLRLNACGETYSCRMPIYAPYDNETLVPAPAEGGVECKPSGQP